MSGKPTVTSQRGRAFAPLSGRSAGVLRKDPHRAVQVVEKRTAYRSDQWAGRGSACEPDCAEASKTA